LAVIIFGLFVISKQLGDTYKLLDGKFNNNKDESEIVGKKHKIDLEA